MPLKFPPGSDYLDEGTPLGRVDRVNFVGAGVSSAISNGLLTVTISGGGGGGGPHATDHLADGADAIAWTTVHARGTLGARPAAAADNAGYLYASTTDDVLYYSDGASWYTIADVGGGGGGHVIKDAGSAMTQRSNLDFQDGFVLADNSGADSTDIDLDYGGTSELTDLTFAGAESAGTSSKVARADHVHAITGTLAVNRGGTGATDASGARTNLGLVIGTNVQAWSTRLDEFAALSVANGDIIYYNSGWQRLAKGTARQVLRMNSAATLPEWGRGSGVIARDTGKTISSSSGWATETSATSVLNGTLTIPANTLVAGDLLRIVHFGELTNNSGGSLAYTFNLPFGLNLTTGNLAASANKRIVTLIMDIQIRQIGAVLVAAEVITGRLTITAQTTSTVFDTIVAASTFEIGNLSTVSTEADINLDLTIASAGTGDTQQYLNRGMSLALIPSAV